MPSDSNHSQPTTASTHKTSKDINYLRHQLCSSFGQERHESTAYLNAAHTPKKKQESPFSSIQRSDIMSGLKRALDDVLERSFERFVRDKTSSTTPTRQQQQEEQGEVAPIQTGDVRDIHAMHTQQQRGKRLFIQTSADPGVQYGEERAGTIQRDTGIESYVQDPTMEVAYASQAIHLRRQPMRQQQEEQAGRPVESLFREQPIYYQPPLQTPPSMTGQPPVRVSREQGGQPPSQRLRYTPTAFPPRQQLSVSLHQYTTEGQTMPPLLIGTSQWSPRTTTPMVSQPYRGYPPEEGTTAVFPGYRCGQCPMVFDNRQLLESHMNIMHPPPKFDSFVCQACNQAFENRQLLERHSCPAQQPTSRPFPCEYCGQSFGRKSILKNHISTVHHRQRKYACEVEGCGNAFALKSDLKRHVESVHEKRRPYKCEICNQNFARRSDLKRHRQSLHPEAASPPHTPRRGSQGSPPPAPATAPQ